MARFALIKDGVVDNVIEAEPAFFAEPVHAEFVAQFDIIEVVTEDEVPLTVDAIVTRDCEPGATYEDRPATMDEKARAAADESMLAPHEIIEARSTEGGRRRAFNRGGG